MVQEEGEQLRVVLSLEQPRDKAADSIPSKEIMATGAMVAAGEKKISAPVVVPDTPALMTGIEFNTEPSGRSDIRVETDHPIKYDTTPAPAQ